MNYYTSLVKQIDQLKAQGKIVKLTKLPSVVNIKRKSIRFWFLTTTVHLFILLIMQNIIIHCQPSMLPTIKELELDYQELYDEVDVTIPYVNDVIKLNNSTDDDAEFVNHFGLDYEQVNCIELI